MALNIFRKNKKDEKASSTKQSRKEDVQVKEDLKEPLNSASNSGKKVKLSHNSLSYRIIEGPHISEKASNFSADGKYVFRVMKYGNKIQIKKAVETLYNVKVKEINIVSVPSKKRKVGRFEGIKSGYKKAIITLSKGQTIDVTPR